MGRRRYLLLQRNEWDRIKRQAGVPEEPSKVDNEYIKVLIEKSQQWIKTWPDTIQGHVAKLEKLKAKKLEDNIADFKAFSMKKRQEKAEAAIKKAKQMIFEDSCYGKKLQSALVESKTLEERDIQVKFQKEAADLETKKQPKPMLLSTFNLGDNAHLSKLKAMECAQINKDIAAMKKQKSAKIRRHERESKVEETLINEVLDREAKEKEEIKLVEKQAIEECIAEQKIFKELRAKRAEHDDVIAEAYRKDQERIKCKIHRVYEQIHKNKQDTAGSKSCYKFIAKVQDLEKKRYDQLVEKGIKDLEQRNSKLEQEKVEDEKREQHLRCLIAQRNKIYGDIERKYPHTNKCFCDRQSLITKSHKIPLKIAYEYEDGDLKNTKSSFLKPCNKLEEELKIRKKEQSPWNGADAAHAQFAREANDTLRQCTYKNMAHKVVDVIIKVLTKDIPLTFQFEQLFLKEFREHLFTFMGI